MRGEPLITESLRRFFRTRGGCYLPKETPYFKWQSFRIQPRKSGNKVSRKSVHLAEKRPI